MVRKKLDNRIRVLIENCVILHHRSLFVVVGEKGRDAIPILHEMLSKAEVKARPTVLWCYKKDLGFSTNKKKQKRLKKAAAAQHKQYLDENDSIEYFIASTNIRYCYYSETHSIMGQTFGMAILQDFEAITPNLLARTIETVEGGGMVLILLQTITSIKQLYTMAMDVHARYRTEAHQNVVCRFNERFILSLAKSSNCLFLDDKLNVLPIKSNALDIKPLPRKSWDDPKTPEEEKLIALKSSLDTSELTNVLVKKCKTMDQAEAVIKFIDSLSEMTLRSTVTLTAARGRGKSAALGLAVAAAIAYKYPNIAVTSPHPENLKTFFRFLLEGLDALGYEKSTDYEEVRSTEPEFNKAIIQVNVNRKIRQRVRYVPPNTPKLDNVELLVIDEAAAIPLPFVKALMGPYLIFLASTVHGYEGTGRSLSLKLISQLRKESVNNLKPGESNKKRSLTGRVLHELTLNESIRYKRGDKVEEWLNKLLCLNVTIPPTSRNTALSPDKCKLCYVNRDTLFSYHKDAERFLHNLVSILVASHYKNSPNDLQIMSDAPAHHIFCLCAPTEESEGKQYGELPEVLCVLQVCLEGKISEDTVKHELSRGRRGAGDLIPWTISQEFTQEDFPSLSGARVVRIATHPEYQRKGFGYAALRMLEEFYEGKYYQSCSTSSINMAPLIYNEEEMIEEALVERLDSQTSLPTLFPPLNELKPDILDYLGVSFGLSEDLLRFWKRANFNPVYLSYIPNQLTGEHACIMLKQLKGSATTSMWLPSFGIDFTFKTIETLQLLKLDTMLALNLISQDVSKDEIPSLSQFEILNYLEEDIAYLRAYCSNSKFGFPVRQNVLELCKFYFNHRVKGVKLTEKETIVLFSYGIMLKSLEAIAEHLKIDTQQVIDQLNLGLKQIASYVVDICKN